MGTDIWEIPIMDGYSFNQSTNTTEVELNEAADAAGNSRRGRRVFTDSYAPAEWSVMTYVRPFVSAGTGPGAADDAARHHAIEEVLWALFVGDADYDNFAFTGVTPGAGSMTISLANSNKVVLGTADLIFALNGCEGSDVQIYTIKDACVDEITIDFDVQGIASITWSGYGSVIEDSGNTMPVPTVTESIARSDNYIRNKLTTLKVESAMGGLIQSSYNVTLTGGSITFSNNIEYLIPEDLCKVNQPIGHITGTRSVSGNFTAFLVTGTGDNTADLFEDIIESKSIVTNEFDLEFTIGGPNNLPRMAINVPQAHLEIPEHNIEDVIALDVNFHGLPSDVNVADEANIIYTGSVAP